MTQRAIVIVTCTLLLLMHAPTVPTAFFQETRVNNSILQFFFLGSVFGLVHAYYLHMHVENCFQCVLVEIFRLKCD